MIRDYHAEGRLDQLDPTLLADELSEEDRDGLGTAIPLRTVMPLSLPLVPLTPGAPEELSPPLGPPEPPMALARTISAPVSS
jgi:hypothetical protein